MSKDNKTDQKRDAILEAIPVEAVSDICPRSKTHRGFSRKGAGNFKILVVKYVKEECPSSFLRSHIL
jgi:hypothetical protein